MLTSKEKHRLTGHAVDQAVRTDPALTTVQQATGGLTLQAGLARIWFVYAI